MSIPETYVRNYLNDEGQVDGISGLTSRLNTFVYSSSSTFTLSDTPDTTYPTFVYKNQILQYYGETYTISGTTLTYSGSLTAGDTVTVRYWVVSGGCTATCSSSLSIVCNNPPQAIVGAYYYHQFPALGGTPPFTWSISSGSLPPGLSLEVATGIVSGVPTSGATGTYSFTVTVTGS